MKTFIQLLIFTFAVLFGTANAASFRTVVIDAGHGGHDKGGLWGRVYEKHLALDTATRLQANLRRLGYNTVMTRRSDYFISLPQRAHIGNRYRGAIFVSIHYNYTTKSSVSGIETFYYGSEGQRLAQHVQNAVIRRTRTSDRKAKFARFYVLRNSQLPAILVEGGFVSNNMERRRMMSGQFRESIARGITEGIQAYRRSW